MLEIIVVITIEAAFTGVTNDAHGDFSTTLTTDMLIFAITVDC